MAKKRIVFIGGGTGLSHAIAGFKNQGEYKMTAVISVADDGGSSGDIIKHYNIIPPGDVRKVCFALANDESMLNLFDFRFDNNKSDKFNGSGHHLGNLLFTAMNEKNGNKIFNTIDDFCELLKVNKNNKIVPIGISPVELKAKVASGDVIVGQNNIQHSFDNAIEEIWIDSQHALNPYVANEIKNADYIVLAPGSLYTSTIVNFLFTQVVEEISLSNAPILYLANVMSQHGETDNMSLSDHVKAIEKYLHKKIDLVVCANTHIPDEIIESYFRNSQQLLDNENINTPTLFADILSFSEGKIFHDGVKIINILRNIIND